MRLRKRSLLMFLAAVSMGVGMVAVRGGSPTLVRAWNPSQAPAIDKHLWDSALSVELNYNAPGSAAAQDPPPPTNYQPSSASGCPDNIGSNVKVDQGCLNLSALNSQGRGQAHNETAIAINPSNKNQLVAASNDYQLGDGLAGGTSYSNNGGKNWQNSAVPLEYTPGADFSATSPHNQCSSTPEPATVSRVYWQGGGDPSVAWDTKGNAYFAGLHFHRGAYFPPAGMITENPDYSSGVYVQRSTGNGGASWNFPGVAAVTCSQPPSTSPANLEDKPYLAIDTGSSPTSHTDRIYVTWTFFPSDFTAYIYEAYSTDYGRSFSAPVLVSQNSTLCPQNYSFIGVAPEAGNNCDANQFSDPFVGPDGSLYVAYANYNTATAVSSSGDNATQILLEKSTNGGASFGPPVQVGSYYDLPDCGAYQGGQDEGRACVPEQGSQQESVFRATNLPSGGADPTNSSRVVITYGSYINKDSNATTGCLPNGTDPDVFTQLYSGVKTSACANKILVSVSGDGGATFSGTGADPRTMTIVPQSGSQQHNDQWFQWAAFNKDGKFAVSYYDRSYGNDITNGAMDITLSSAQKSGTTFKQTRVTTSSMPVPTEFPDAQGNSIFFGDYTGLAVADNAYPLWSDTREPDLMECPASGPPTFCTFTEPGTDDKANNEDIFTASVSLSGEENGGDSNPQ